MRSRRSTDPGTAVGHRLSLTCHAALPCRQIRRRPRLCNFLPEALCAQESGQDHAGVGLSLPLSLDTTGNHRKELAGRATCFTSLEFYRHAGSSIMCVIFVWKPGQTTLVQTPSFDVVLLTALDEYAGMHRNLIGSLGAARMIVPDNAQTLLDRKLSGLLS